MLITNKIKIMKKFIITIAFITSGILMSTNYSLAQKGFQIGLEGTPQFSYLHNKDDKNSSLYKGKNAFNSSFGISGQYGFTEKMGIGLNVLYSFQGSKYEWKGVERYNSLQYIKIPVMFTLCLPLGDKILFVSKVGPQVNVLSNAKMLDSDNKILKRDYSSAYSSIDFEGMISAGIAYKINDKFSIDGAIRYDMGFTNSEDKDFTSWINIHDPYDYVTSSPGSPRGITNNITIGVNIGIRYNFK